MALTKVLAFDIGIKNLAFCVLENNNSVLALENCNILEPVEQVNCSKCTVKASYKAGDKVFCKRHGAARIERRSRSEYLLLHAILSHTL